MEETLELTFPIRSQLVVDQLSLIPQLKAQIHFSVEILASNQLLMTLDPSSKLSENSETSELLMIKMETAEDLHTFNMLVLMMPKRH